MPMGRPTVQGYQTKVLLAEDSTRLQELLERCTDYALLVDGSLPRPNAAVLLLADHPPGVTPDDKLVFGVHSQDGKMVAVLDAVRDYPAHGTWWLGLLLIDPAYRNQGLGREIYRSFEDWLHGQHCQGVYLGVLDENQDAFRFWQALGFVEYERQAPRQIGLKEHTVITMIRKFPEDSLDRD